MENNKRFEGVELDDKQLEEVVGGFDPGQTVYLKSGRIYCTECGMKNITSGTYEGQDGNTRLALVTFPCGHQTHIPERVIQS